MVLGKTEKELFISTYTAYAACTAYVTYSAYTANAVDAAYATYGAYTAYETFFVGLTRKKLLNRKSPSK